MNLYWNHTCVTYPHAPSVVMKTADIVKRIESQPIADVQVVDPMDDFYADGKVWVSSFDVCALEHVEKVHSPEYVEAVRTGTPAHLAESSGITWSEALFPAAIAQISCVMAAVHHALDGQTQAGSISPNMNHARSGGGSKQCIFNGIAAAVSYAITGWDLSRILVIDCDKLWADGTEEILASLFAGRTTHVDVASVGGGRYPEREGNIAKSVSRLAYADRTEMAVQRMLADETYDLVIYNAGMNPVETGVDVEELSLRERMVRAYIGDIPAVFLSGGGSPSSGLSMESLVDLHLLTVREWARHERLSS